MSKMIYVSRHPTPVEQQMVMVIVITGLFSAVAWKVFMTLLGMPISGSHSLIGGVVGSAVAASGVSILVGPNIGKTLLAMLLAPALGFTAAYFLYVALIRLTVSWRPSTMNLTFGKVQILSAGCVALTHGTNDAQKVMGIITMALIAGGFHDTGGGDKFVVPLWVQIACAVAISIGTAVGGWKVIKTLGHSLTKIGPPEGCAAETSALTTTSHKSIWASSLSDGCRAVPIKTATAQTCSTIFVLPSAEAAIVNPSADAMLRRPRTVNSRPMMMTTIHPGTSLISTSDTNAADIRSLSAIGSSNMPRVVTWRRRRAK
jgi:hypothetical protein